MGMEDLMAGIFRRRGSGETTVKIFVKHLHLNCDHHLISPYHTTKSSIMGHENTGNDHQGSVELTFIQILPTCNEMCENCKEKTHVDIED